MRTCSARNSGALDFRLDPKKDRENFYGGALVLEFPSKPTSSRCKVDGGDCETLHVVRCLLRAPVRPFLGPDLPPAGEVFGSDWSGKTDPCESPASCALGDGILTATLSLLFKGAPPASSTEVFRSLRLRGIHAGKFVWESATFSKGSLKVNGGLTIRGQMAGTNSTGMVRNPVLAPIPDPLPVPPIDQKYRSETCNAPVLHGRLTGSVNLKDPKKLAPSEGCPGPNNVGILRRAQVSAIYRITYDPSPSTEFVLDGKKLKLDVPTTVGRGVLNGVLLLRCKAEG